MNSTLAAPSTKSASGGDHAEYRSFSVAAVGSLICGLLSPISLAGPLLLIVPVMGIGLAWLALREIAASQGEVVGRRTALTGLALSVMFGVAGPAQTVATSYRLSAAARPIADQLFEFLLQDRPHYAHQLATAPHRRRVLNENLWRYYTGDKEAHDDLTKWVAQPVVRFLLENRDKAQVRFYERGSVSASGEPQFVDLVYAVTYPAGGGKQTFFVRATVERRTMASGELFWRVVGLEGGYRPPAYGG